MSKSRHEAEAGVSSRATRRRVQQETAETKLASLTTFEKLPAEVLDLIFQNISCKDILNMALVSKTFNSFIATSSMVMSRFKITIDMNELRFLRYVGERNVLPKDLQMAWELLQKFGLSGEEIYLQDTLSQTVIIRLFKIYKNVKSFKTPRIRHTSMKRDPKILSLNDIVHKGATPKAIEESKLAIEAQLKLDPAPLDLPELKTLDYFVGSVQLSFFGSCQLKEMTIREWNFNWSHLHILEVKKFLETQKTLETMKLEGSWSMLFAQKVVTTVSFKLKRLELENPYSELDATTLKNFDAFIKPHKQSLERLKCKNPVLLSHFADFKSLSSLELHLERNNMLPQDIVMPQVKILTICLFFGGSLGNCGALLPNLQELRVDILFTPIESYQGIENCSKLEKLTLRFKELHDDEVPILKMPNLKQLHIIKYPFSHRPFDFEVMPHLEELTIEFNYEGKNSLWLIDFLNLKSTKLNQLKVISWKLKVQPEIQQAIDENRHKIKKFVFKQAK